MKTIIYHNPRCSKSREALDLLRQKDENIEIREYLKTPPSKKELQDLVKLLGIRPEQLIRKNEAIYNTFKDKSFSGEEWIDIMVAHPVLIERPVVIKNNKAVIGRPVQLVIDLIKS